MVKKFEFYWLVILMACNTKSSDNKFQFKYDKNSIVSIGSVFEYTKNSTQDCLVEFVKFREIIYQKNKSTAKQYFKFPIVNESIWSIINLSNYKISNTGVPFTEKDFERYFDNLFSKRLVQSLLKVKSKELFSVGKYETVLMEDYSEGDLIKYKMIATYKENKLNLMLYEEYQDGNEVYETGIEYLLVIEGNCNFKFINFTLAG